MKILSGGSSEHGPCIVFATNILTDLLFCRDEGWGGWEAWHLNEALTTGFVEVCGELKWNIKFQLDVFFTGVDSTILEKWAFQLHSNWCIQDGGSLSQEWYQVYSFLTKWLISKLRLAKFLSGWSSSWSTGSELFTRKIGCKTSLWVLRHWGRGTLASSPPSSTVKLGYSSCELVWMW